MIDSLVLFVASGSPFRRADLGSSNQMNDGKLSRI